MPNDPLDLDALEAVLASDEWAFPGDAEKVMEQLPALIARARLAERMVEALDAVRESIERDIGVGGLTDDEIVKQMNFAERAGARKWKRTRAVLMLRGLLREWDEMKKEVTE